MAGESNSRDMAVIGDQNTVLGLKLAGISGRVVENLTEAQSALDELLAQNNLQILLITEDWAAQMRDRIDQLKLTRMEPVVLEIPGGEGGPPVASLRELVQAVIGIKLGG
jgi:V/A-type H+-transporting ATPase subunit F